MKSTLLLKRGALAATIAAVLAFLGSLVALMLVYWCLRPFVWAALYGVPYSPPSGPYLPSSGEWLFAKGVALLSSAAAGYAAAKWSGAQTWVWAALAIVLLSVNILSGMPAADMSGVRQAVYLLAHPLGVVCGALLFFRRSITKTRNI